SMCLFARMIMYSHRTTPKISFLQQLMRLVDEELTLSWGESAGAQHVFLLKRTCIGSKISRGYSLRWFLKSSLSIYFRPVLKMGMRPTIKYRQQVVTYTLYTRLFQYKRTLDIRM